MRKHDLSFQRALGLLKRGFRVSRSGWNGKGMYLKLIKTWSIHKNYGELAQLPASPFIAMKTAQGDLVPWLASQTDILAKDWCVSESAI